MLLANSVIHLLAIIIIIIIIIITVAVVLAAAANFYSNPSQTRSNKDSEASDDCKFTE
jgi:uncharacterized membrane protein YidH (DUF202 family)